MPTETTNLELFKYDTETDGDLTYNIDLALNDNFDKIDTFAGSVVPKSYVTSKGTTALPVYFDENGEAQTITNYEGNSATATKATQDGAGNVITSTYVDKTSAQTISGSKTFTGTPVFNGASIGSAMTVKRTVANGGSGITFSNSDVALGVLGITSTKKPMFYDTSAHNLAYTAGNDTVVGSTTKPVYVTSGGQVAECNTMVDTTSAQTITATKTFKTANFGEQIVINRDYASGVPLIAYAVQGTVKGYVGTNASGLPAYYNTSKTGQLLLRQKTLSTAQGGAKQPIYIDANGVAQTCNAYSTLNSISFPDLANPVTIDITNMGTTNKTFTVSSDGYLQFKQTATNGGDVFYLDDKAIWYWSSAYSYPDSYSPYIPVKSGSHTFRTQYYATRIGGIYFYALKGA